MFEFEKSEDCYTVKLNLKTFGALTVALLAMYGLASLVLTLLMLLGVVHD